MEFTFIVRDDLLPDITNNLQSAGEALARIFIDKAYTDSQDNVPVDLGRLKESGHIEEIDHGFALVYDAGNDHSGDPYGRYVEYGTRFMAAQPFIVPAFETALEHLLSQVESVFEGLLT